MVFRILSLSRLTALATVSVAASLLASSPAQAGVLDGYTNTPAFGVGVTGDIRYQDYCQVARADAGVGGGGGITYHIVAEATMVGAQVLDTLASCKIKQDGVVRYIKSSAYAPGFAAAISDSWTTTSLSPLLICSGGTAFLKDGTKFYSGWHNQSGSACSF